MGSRGQSSMTSKRQPAKTQSGHLRANEIPDTPEKTAAYLGTSVEEAARLHKAVNDYTGEDYAAIRAAQRGETSDPIAIAQAEEVERYIELAPKWNGGTTYRGIGLSKEKAAELLSGWNKGAIIDINYGTASWTSSKNVAKEFAEDGETRLVFSCKTQSRGTTIRHLSRFSREDEVLVSKASKYRVVGMPKTYRGYLYIEVEEA